MTSKSQQKRIAALKGGAPHVTTTREGVEMRRTCVWCNCWEADAKGLTCSAPDGDGHLFRLAPVTASNDPLNSGEWHNPDDLVEIRRLRSVLDEIAKRDSSEYSAAHRRLVKLAREALRLSDHVTGTRHED